MGRPRLLPNELSRATSITLSNYHMRLLEMVGGGNRSVGVRIVVDFYLDQTGTDIEELERLQREIEAQLGMNSYEQEATKE